MESAIKKKIEYYCAYQERCHADVLKKLNKLGIYGEDIDKYICHLIDENFLSETRFSELYVRGKFNNNNWGKIKIKRELKSKNISEWNIENALNQISESEYIEKLRKLCVKFSEVDTNNKFDAKNKIIRSLSYKGWETELIINTLNQLIK
tara:strand:- start:179 stop:628 length:450 start_codon:yes stop_codon:yes gene_type:complete